MKKYILFSCLAVTLNADYKDTKPNTITKEDLKIIKNFDIEINNIAEHKTNDKININEVVNYIYRNRRHIEDFTRLKIDALGTLGYRTARGGIDSGATLVSTDNYNYYKIGVALTYNIFDEKTTKQIKNEKLKYKDTLILLVQKYASAKNKVQNLKNEIELDRLKQIRLKLMVKTAQKYLDERIQILTKLLQDRETLTEQTIILQTTKEQLLNLVTNSAKSKLKEIL